MFSKEIFSILKKSKSLQTTLAAEAHLTEGRDTEKASVNKLQIN
jgi:hypothetical protein